MRPIAGIFHAVVAVVTGYWGLQVMFSDSSGGRFFWWPVTMLGASILLLVGSVLILFPQMKKRWLVGLAGTILFIIWVAFMRDFSWTYCIFAAAVTLITWGTLAFASTLKRPATAPLLASLMLTVAWLPSSVYAFRVTFAAIPPFTNALVLGRLLVLWALVITSVIVGAVLSRLPALEAVRSSEGPGGQPAGPSTTH